MSQIPMPGPSGRLRRLARALALAAAFAVAPTVAVHAQAPVPPAATDDAARAEAAFDAAHALYTAGLFGPAARAFAAFRDAFPGDARAPEALLFHAASALAGGDDQLATALYERVETDYPLHPLAAEARLALGRTYYARGDYARAETALLAALDRPAPPERAAETAYLLGQTYLAQNRADEAAGAFARAAQADTPTAAPALYALGTVRMAQADAPGAAEAFGALSQRYPGSADDARVRLALAEALLRSERLDEAAAEAERRRATLTGDDAERAALLVGETRVQLNQPEAALVALDAVPADSRYARRAALAAGRALFAQERWADAATRLAVARTGTAADPAGADGTDDAVAHEATYYEGLALKADGRLGDAADRLASAVLRRPDGAYADAATLELGLLRYERRQYAEAVQNFARLANAQPRGPYAGEAARLLGEAYAAQGDAARSREAFRLAETLGTATAGTRTEVSFQDAFALYTAGDFDRATPALEAVARQDPDGSRAGEALFWAGESAYQAGRFAQAEGLLADFLRLHPDHRQAVSGRYVLAWTYFARRDYAASARAFAAFLAAYEGQAETVPYTADALLRLGDSYYALGRFDDARAAYARVPAATPDARGADYALYQTAQTFEGQGRTADAAEAYARLAATYPASDLLDEALVARGTLLVQSDPEAAVADFQRVLAERGTTPTAAQAAVGVGDARFNQERYADAEAAYRLALDRYPASPSVADALAGLDYTLAAVGRESELPAIVEGVEARATDPEARARIRLARARTALAGGDAAAAVALLTSLAPPPAVEPEWLIALADAHAEAGNQAESVAALRRLLSRYAADPLAPEAQLQLAEALLAAGDSEAARTEAVRFQSAFPDDAERLASAIGVEARALVALGRTADADARLRVLVTQYPGSSSAREALRARPDLAPPSP